MTVFARIEGEIKNLEGAIIVDGHIGYMLADKAVIYPPIELIDR